MKIYISADIEGITGVTHWDEAGKNKTDYHEFASQMTAEVTAACEGAIAAGATEIWLKDAHGSGRNIISNQLPEIVRLIRGWSHHPYCMMQELDKSFRASIMIGYHSFAGSDENPLSHTLTGKSVYIKINGNTCSEFLLNSYTSALVDVPVVFVSGDEGICREAENIIPGIETCGVKQGVGASTINIHPKLAVEKIREGVRSALKREPFGSPLELPEYFEVEIRYKEHSQAYQAAYYPGAKLKEPYVIEFGTDNYFDVLRFLSFVV